jgi:hypothetical protein
MHENSAVVVAYPAANVSDYQYIFPERLMFIG